MLKLFRFNKIVNILRNTLNIATISTTCNYRKVGGKKSPKIKEAMNKMQRKWQPNLMKLERNNVFQRHKGLYTLLSYNILSQDLLAEHIQLYYDIDAKLLRWENRLTKLKEEVAQLKPDIMCLQEMQYDHLKDLVHQFSIAASDDDGSGAKRKLEYVFKKKTGTRSDGCAIIYDKSKFKLISEHFVEYYTDGVSTLNRENIAVMAKFQIVNDPNVTQFVVATTHLLYNPKREDVRISQVNKLLRAIISYSSVPVASCDSDNKHRLPVILTGDFNFTPDTRAFENLTALRRPTPSALKIQEDPSNEDSFQMEPVDFGSDGASTYQKQWVTVDYILSSRSTKKKEQSIRVESKYQLPTVDTCWKHGKIPSRFVGSDHFSLAIQFSIS